MRLCLFRTWPSGMGRSPLHGIHPPRCSHCRRRRPVLIEQLDGRIAVRLISTHLAVLRRPPRAPRPSPLLLQPPQVQAPRPQPPAPLPRPSPPAGTDVTLSWCPQDRVHILVLAQDHIRNALTPIASLPASMHVCGELSNGRTVAAVVAHMSPCPHVLPTAPTAAHYPPHLGHPSHAVQGVSHQGMSHGCRVDADLVGPACEDLHLAREEERAPVRQRAALYSDS